MVALAAFRADNGRALFYCVFGTGLKRYQRIRLYMAQAALNNEKLQPLVMLTCFFSALSTHIPQESEECFLTSLCLTDIYLMARALDEHQLTSLDCLSQNLHVSTLR